MKEVKVYVGLDLAKAYLNLAWTTQRKRLCNAAAGRSQLLKWLGQIASQVDVIYEASGGYERAPPLEPVAQCRTKPSCPVILCGAQKLKPQPS